MNAFEQLADTQLTQAAKARHHALEKRMANLVVRSERDAPMVASPADRESFEAAQQFRLYNKFIKERSDNLLTGQYGEQVRTLFKILNDLSASPPGALVEWIKHSQLDKADYNTRHNVLAIIGRSIARHRIRQGLAPFDDSLPFSDEQPTVFEQIRTILTGVGA
jgi:hypothetical protein